MKFVSVKTGWRPATEHDIAFLGKETLRWISYVSDWAGLSNTFSPNDADCCDSVINHEPCLSGGCKRKCDTGDRQRPLPMVGSAPVSRWPSLYCQGYAQELISQHRKLRSRLALYQINQKYLASAFSNSPSLSSTCADRLYWKWTRRDDAAQNGFPGSSPGGSFAIY